ncbi:MAG TPA: GNAT family N-acetyltransferase [Gaiellaceae bacterium]
MDTRYPCKSKSNRGREQSFLVTAYDGGDRIGHAFVHELPRPTRARSMFLVYDVRCQLGRGDVGLRVHGRLTSLRPATAGDVDRLVAWHADPDVARYWDGETFTTAEMAERLARDDVDAWIVEGAGGEPVGYLQTHPEGIDMFLIPSVRGRGLGPDAARAMTEHLLASGRTRVTVDPYEWNESAIRAWQRAGFVEVSRGHPPDEDHASPWVLMEYRAAR